MTSISPYSVSVQEIMTKRVVTVEMDDSLSTIKGIFDAASFRHLLVVDAEKKLCGIVSDRDLLRALSPYLGTRMENSRDLATLNKKAHQIMSRGLVTLNVLSSVESALQAFSQHKISCLPVIDGENRPIGIVSWRDLLHHFASEDVRNRLHY